MGQPAHVQLCLASPRFFTVAVLFLILSFPVSHSGEKIKFYEAEADFKVPKAGSGNRPDDTSENTPSSSRRQPEFPRPSVPPSVDPSLFNQRLQELMEKRKNWIFQDRTTKDQDALLQDMFQIRDYTPESGEDREKGLSSAERRFLGNSKAKTQESKPKNNPTTTSPDRDSEDSYSSFKSSWDSSSKEPASSEAQDGVIQELNLNQLLRKTAPVHFQNSLDKNDPFRHRVIGAQESFRSGSSSSSLYGNKSESRFVEKYFENASAMPQGNTKNQRLVQDPLAVLHTEREMNPVTPQRSFTSYDNQDRRNTEAPAKVSPSDSLRNLDALGGFQSKSFDGSSFSPTVVIPSSPGTLMPRQPAVLELPRRKF